MVSLQPVNRLLQSGRCGLALRHRLLNVLLRFTEIRLDFLQILLDFVELVLRFTDGFVFPLLVLFLRLGLFGEVLLCGFHRQAKPGDTENRTEPHSLEMQHRAAPETITTTDRSESASDGLRTDGLPPGCRWNRH